MTAPQPTTLEAPKLPAQESPLRLAVQQSEGLLSTQTDLNARKSRAGTICRNRLAPSVFQTFGTQAKAQAEKKAGVIRRQRIEERVAHAA